MMNSVTLQINLAPFDYRHSKNLLLHQIDTFDKGINEILFTYDDGGGKRRRLNWETADAKMRKIMHELAARDARISIRPVEYDDKNWKKVSSYFCTTGTLPLYDFRGAPFYQYFHGIHSARNDLILHIDSDMFFGGGGGDWISEAQSILNSDSQVLIVSPHPGPPHPERILRKQICEPYGTLPHSYAFNTVSTRIFFIDRRSLRGVIVPCLPNPLKVAWAIHKHFPLKETAEYCISEAMRKMGRIRVDTLGNDGGTWSLHPQRRSESFYTGIEEIISRLKSMDVPEDQLGSYDFTDTFFDWGVKIKPPK